MTKPVVFVLGATGNIGSATVATLSAKYADKVEIRAGVRNPERADKIKSLAGVTVVQATMGDKKLEQVLTGVDTLYIVTPGAENRAALTVSSAELAKKAGVKHIALVSVLTANFTDTVFGRQLTEVEHKVSKLGVPYTFIRLPIFTENFWGFKDTIVKQGAIYSPVNPEKTFTSVAVEDAASAGAAILVNPSSYANKTVDINSNRITYNKVAEGFSDALGKEVKYVRVPYEAAKKAFLEMGFPEWQVDGILELFKLIDAANPVMSNSDLGTFTEITGDQPTDLKKWLAKYAGGFQ